MAIIIHTHIHSLRRTLIHGLWLHWNQFNGKIGIISVKISSHCYCSTEPIIIFLVCILGLLFLHLTLSLHILAVYQQRSARESGAGPCKQQLPVTYTSTWHPVAWQSLAQDLGAGRGAEAPHSHCHPARTHIIFHTFRHIHTLDMLLFGYEPECRMSASFFAASHVVI